ncbi:MAG: hypothetical protein ABUK18_11215 [Candidatus Bathyarchaeia archaeon]
MPSRKGLAPLQLVLIIAVLIFVVGARAELTEDDIDQIKFKGIIGGHHAYRCKKCDYIIRFSSMWRS